MNNGADFSDLPDMNQREDKDDFKGKFELSPYLGSAELISGHR